MVMAGQEKSGKKMTLHLRPNPRSGSGQWHLQSSLCHCDMGADHNMPSFCPARVLSSLGGARTWENTELLSLENESPPHLPRDA